MERKAWYAGGWPVSEVVMVAFTEEEKRSLKTYMNHSWQPGLGMQPGLGYVFIYLAGNPDDYNKAWARFLWHVLEKGEVQELALARFSGDDFRAAFDMDIYDALNALDIQPKSVTM